VRAIGIVTGSRAEARCLPAIEGRIACSGADAARARRQAERLAAEVAGLASFGLAGALAPNLKPGDLLLPQEVIAPDGSHIATDPAWRERLIALAGAANWPDPLLGSDALVGSVAAKAALRRASGAIAVDMESHAVALAARAAGVPFVVVRAIADPADQALPAAARVALNGGGRVRVPAMAAALLRHPGELPALLRLAGQSGAGLRTLRRVAARAGPSLGLG
jgi:adenosylhomocysteine nucleosidase